MIRAQKARAKKSGDVELFDKLDAEQCALKKRRVQQVRARKRKPPCMSTGQNTPGVSGQATVKHTKHAASVHRTSVERSVENSRELRQDKVHVERTISKDAQGNQTIAEKEDRVTETVTVMQRFKEKIEDVSVSVCVFMLL